MQRVEFHRHVGAENMLPSVDTALRRAREIFGATQMRTPPHAG